MIYIDKNGHPAPQILQVDGLNAKSTLQQDYLRAPIEFHAVSPTKPDNKHQFDTTIYGDQSVKDDLCDIQNEKCCFCEAKMRHVSDGDVEHFRPKGRWKQINGSPLNYPGYYWKAYDWDNLYLACQRCNQREKGDLFPLEEDSPRAIDHTIDISVERPLFIDPGNDNPEEHICFYYQYVAHLTERGYRTIKEVGLDRDLLDSNRNDRLEGIKALEDMYILTKGTDIEQAACERFFNRLRYLVSSKGEYSNMMKCNFREYLDQL